MHNYHDTHKGFPTAVSFDTQGKKTRLSWRVHLLPYLEESELYREFHLDEPWDSEHNKKLITRMPPIFRPANPQLAAAGKTTFVVPLGPGTVFPLKKKQIGLRDIRDGASNTIMMVEADDARAVIWSKPDDLEINVKKPLDGLAVRPPGACLTLFADGSVRCYSVAFGPVKWRMFFARIDDALYVASKRFILDDLAAATKEDRADGGPAAHAMVRVRPEHWNEVLPAFRLGWAETSREACLNNLGPLSSVARALTASTGGKVGARRIHREADRLHAVHFFCPDRGRYARSPDGKQMVCSVHGSAAEPRQRPAPAPSSPMGRLMQEFSGLTAQLIFLEDGLHAVVTVDRK